ncbi:MAG: hypothetical protein EPO25_05080 [Gammaproteobacteria bacterium]|nr:MAG: hypothetical protein EPO25_05080 [Gammaproteobacteria bacterium]
MALETELRSRVDQSLRELQEVVGSLHHVKRLADTQHASAEQLSRVASAMETAAGQFGGLLESVGKSSAILVSAVEAVRAADPAVVVSRVDAVGHAVAATVQLGEFARGELEAIRVVAEGTCGRIDAAARAQAAAIERLEKGVSARFEQAGERIAAIEKRVRTAIMATWFAAGLALIAAVAGVAGLLK